MALAEATESTPSAAAGPTPSSPNAGSSDPTSAVFEEFPLTGCVVAVTADRRRDDLASLLRRRGAKVIETPTLRLVPLDDDAALRKATNECLIVQLDYAVATTGSGWRGWMSAAESWGLGEELNRVLSNAIVVSRGPKATGAVRASGLRESYSAPSESSDEVLAYLLEQGVKGKRIAVQQYGVENPAEDTRFVTALREAGAIVMDIPVYRWGPPADRAAVRRLVDAIVRREVHAVSFTSAPGVTALLEAAAVTGALDQLLVALRTDVTAVCVGPVCARPLEALDVRAVWPDRARLGAMVATLCSVLPPKIRHEFPIDEDRTLTLQGLAAVVTGNEPVLLAPLPAAVLAELGRRPGWVVSRADLLRRVWGPRGAGSGGRDEHAVEATVARLRTALGPDASLIKTVTKRGYRLAIDPS
ncbi:uroporphyrinogen-III synthase [Actinocrinis sp.]|uniref:uroporphyrinogen-III synthase n=1 Tax=Actinocrinis sp. TaxID=1920516 RepID=UPI002BB61879|nr:uroporphyrinogen-III synthase [Actinocrinis sp.]HXR69996.1 uroporphyrinogen-III synthase [Actinocrinis sp.]